MGGHVNLSIDTVLAAAPYVTSDKLGIAVSMAKRTYALPNVPPSPRPASKDSTWPHGRSHPQYRGCGNS